MKHHKVGARTLCEPAQLTCTWLRRSRLGDTFQWKWSRPRCARLRNRNAHGYVRRSRLGENVQWTCSMPRLGQPFLCEPVQSKCTWTSAKKHFMRACSMKMLQTKTWKNSRCRLCASLRSRNAHGHLRRNILCEHVQWKCFRLRPGKTRVADFVRACAVEMHMDICEETFYASMFNENASDQDLEKLALQTLCEPAQSKCTWTSHKSHFMQEFTAKMLGIRWSTLI